METQTDKLYLSKFCAKEDTRYLLKEPWVYQGFRYAVNGFCGLRVPADGEPDSNPLPEKPDDIAKLFQPIGDTLPWPTDGAEMGSVECDDCFGIGKVEQDPCDKCNGTGECTHCGAECGECDGVGMEKFSGEMCKTCKGVGRIEDIVKRRVGAHMIRGNLDRLVRVLPGVRYATGAADPLKALAFAFDGGQGLVMGLREQ
jgi:hypothetical protein